MLGCVIFQAVSTRRHFIAVLDALELTFSLLLKLNLKVEKNGIEGDGSRIKNKLKFSQSSYEMKPFTIIIIHLLLQLALRNFKKRT